MNAPDKLQPPPPVQAAPLPEVRNHAGYPSQYYQMMDAADEIFHVIVTRLTYDLRQLDQDGYPILADEQQPLVDADQFYGEPNTSSCVQESDFAPYKPKCDIIFAHASAHAPQGKPQRRWPVGFRVGACQKTLQVTGPRRLKLGLFSWSLSEPDKAAEVPLRWEGAYGGTCQWPLNLTDEQTPEILSRHKANPIGSGWLDKAWLRRSNVSKLPAPSIEAFGRPFGEQHLYSQNYPAIGVGAVGRWWSPRIQKAGTYDQQWKESRWPRLPQDFDFGYWNCAPQDQQIEYPQGGEEVALGGLMPGRKIDDAWRCRLPQPQQHAVVRMNIGAIVPLPMRLDTLVFDLKAMTLSCVYRTQMAAWFGARVLEIRPGRTPL
jgi:hypothetical protein